MITTLGIISMAFVACFTARAYCSGANPRLAIIEAWVNIGIGFGINYAANWLFLPMVGAHLTAANNFWLGWLYTAVSIIRQYAIRRWFQDRLHHLAQMIAGAR